MQEQAKAELEKTQKAQELKAQKEQEKMEQAKKKEERKKAREENKQRKEAEKAEKALKRKTRGQKGQKDPTTEAEEKKEGQDAEMVVESPAKCPKVDGVDGSPPPKTPKRSASAALLATPRQKAMVKRTRAKISEAAAGSAPPEGVGADAPKQSSMMEKVKTNHELLMKFHEFGADVHYFPTLEQNPSLKSFTVYPFGDGDVRKSKSIGVILFRSSFYVAKAQIPEGLQAILDQKKVTGTVKKDGTGGCSLGWTRFKDVRQAYLSLFRVCYRNETETKKGFKVHCCVLYLEICACLDAKVGNRKDRCGLGGGKQNGRLHFCVNVSWISAPNAAITFWMCGSNNQDGCGMVRYSGPFSILP